MKSYVVLLPTRELIDLIFKLRNEFVELGFNKRSNRFTTLPHVTVSYLKDVSVGDFNKKLLYDLNQVVAHTKIVNLPLESLTNWDGKIVALFNNEPLFSLTAEFERVLSQYGLSGNWEYLEYINSIEREGDRYLSLKVQQVLGDHMKILREIKEDKAAEVKPMLTQRLPKIFTFDRICLIKHGCCSKDIVWSNYLKKQ